MAPERFSPSIPDDPARTAGPDEYWTDHIVDELERLEREDGWNENCDRDPDGECFRGREAEAYTAEQQARIQRELK
jgi:hypothetical protein